MRPGPVGRDSALDSGCGAAYTSGMDTITCNVDDLAVPDRQALEHVLGRPLADHQQVLIAVLAKDANSLAMAAARTRLLKTLQQTANHAAAVGITAETADDAVKEAMQAVRPRAQQP